MKTGELCAGYNGLGMAVEEVFGATPAWFSEYDAAPSKILAHHYPDVPNYGDMTKIDWANIEPADIISGGTPCQDLSNAGKRQGMNEGTRSNLWVQMREAIAIQKPKYVVWENVRGAFSACASSEMGQCPGCLDRRKPHRPFLRALGRVLGDLSDLGYDCQWRGLRASDVGAPHARFRVFVLAQDANVAASGERRLAAYGPWPHLSRRSRTSTAYSSGAGLAVSRERRIPPRQDAGAATFGNIAPVAWGEYEPAIRRWEEVLGRRSPTPTELSVRGFHRLSPRFTEWMMGLPDGWVTAPAIGISRNEQLKACGNGVVPQQAKAALRDMLTTFHTKEMAA